MWRGLHAILLLALLGIACKPTGEPRRHGAAHVESYDAGAVPADAGPVADSSASSGVRLVLPDLDPPEARSGPVAAEIIAGHRKDEPFSAEVRSALTRQPAASDRESAEHHHETGIKHHRRLDIDPAIKAYRAALQAWPAHPGANYHLAAALALRGKWDEALFHLRVLATVGGRKASRRLKEARMDPDFEPIVDDPRFRTLTGYAIVGVAAETRDEAAAMAKTLLDAHIPADIITLQPEHQGKTTLWVSGEDPLASTVAREVTGLLGGKLERELLREPKTEHLLVLWAAKSGPGSSSPQTFGAITDFVEQSLTADHDGVTEKLRLWKTGFFQWTRSELDGTREERTGRYVLEGARLSLDFKRVVTNIRGTGRTQTEQGRRTTHVLRVQGDNLLVDGTVFKPNP